MTMIFTRTFGSRNLAISGMFALLAVASSYAATNISYTGSPFTYGKNTTITTLVPSITGQTPDSITTSPDLTTNTGLTFTKTGANRGQISGKPTLASSATTYTVIAWLGGANNGSTTINITSNGFTYSTPVADYPHNQVIPTNSPGSIVGTGGAYTVNPALPSGLALDGVDGQITGTPTIVQGATKYGVSRNFTGRTASDTITITVEAVVGIQSAPSTFRVALSAGAYTFVLPAQDVNGTLTLVVSDLSGRTIWTTSRKTLNDAKAQEIVWDGKTSAGMLPSPGMYVVRASIRTQEGNAIRFLNTPVSVKP